jgi:hypothetical protein
MSGHQQSASGQVDKGRRETGEVHHSQQAKKYRLNLISLPLCER